LSKVFREETHMAKSRSDRADQPQQQLYCRSCKKDFAVYKAELTAKCPRCGRVCRMPLQRHRLRVAAVAILAGLALAIIVAHVLGR